MTRSLLAFLILSLGVAGCGTLRDPAVYATEIQYIDMTVSRGAPAVHRLLSTSCACAAGDPVVWTSTVEGFSTEDCEANAVWYRTYLARWPWHVAMMRYNGGLIETDPGEIPEVPSTCDLSAPVETSGGAS